MNNKIHEFDSIKFVYRSPSTASSTTTGFGYYNISYYEGIVLRKSGLTINGQPTEYYDVFVESVGYEFNVNREQITEHIRHIGLRALDSLDQKDKSHA